MRSHILFASAAALALAACGNTPAGSGNDGSSVSVDQVDDKSLQDQVMAALDDAPTHGLTRDLFVKGDGAQPLGRDAILQVAADYASALANGKTDPTKLREVYTVPRPKVDVKAGLAQALNEGKYREWVNSLAPQTPEYQALGKAFVQLVQRAPGLPDTEIPAGDTIHPGDTDERMPAIVANLKAQGYLGAGQQPEQQQQAAKGTAGPGPAPAAGTYAPQIVAAVKQWQADSALKPDGVIGPDTVTALNASPRDRARTLAVAMERLRWLDRSPPATRIDVNTAGSFLQYFRDGQKLDERKVVNGQPGWETPQLGAPIYALVANPDWVVPDSIAEKEISQKSASWLAANDFVRKDGKWVQQPGPKSALGLVKFAMRDDQAIYLHDTPSKAAFGRDDRHESHGCVRVENAVQFAHMLAQADGIDAKFSQAMGKDDEIEIKLNHELPVRLLYHTAWLGGDGRVHFAGDVYGWDNDVASALGYPTKAPVERKGGGGDYGP